MAEADGRVTDVVVLIPALNPDEKLPALVRKLHERFSRIVLVNDGSTQGVENFPACESFVEKILVHEVNRGKGAALKTGFAYIGAGADVITADSDGQHTPEDIAKVADALRRHREGLVLGVRTFSGNVPFRSVFGNLWTRWMFFLVARMMIRDTQTGLRGIPASLLARVAAIEGDRYEYEMAVLADARHHPAKPLQIPIATVYIENNAASHFNPLLDSIRIYRTLFMFCLSSVMSFLIDNLVFALVLWLMQTKNTPRREDVLIAIAVSRVLSSHFNYFYNRFVVFRRKENRRARGRGRSYISYFGLVLVIGAADYALTETFSALLNVNGVAITLVKIVVDTFLFLASYAVQKKFIFKAK